MRFNSYDNLRVFSVVARCLNFTSAAKELNLSKGAVSHQISKLEQALGFAVFAREHRGVSLTPKGECLLRVSKNAFTDIEWEIGRLRDQTAEHITVGLSTYFASRWLSPRLMRFMSKQPNIGLRLQPLVDLIDLPTANIDLAIRWGNGEWADLEIEPLFNCPAVVTAGVVVAEYIQHHGLQSALQHFPLLHDRDGSQVWKDWHSAAQIPYRPTSHDLVIPDPNVRVQAVIDGQGIAVNDKLITTEFESGELIDIADTQLSEYGYYLAYPKGAMSNTELKIFRDWLIDEAREFS
jgi:DNA-binding transcriptional LysR family regulator